MPGMQFNMSAVGIPVPEGIYRVLVEEIVVKAPVSKEREYLRERKYLNWKLIILDGEHEGHQLWFITSLVPTALVMLKRAFAAVGVDGDVAIEWEDEYDTMRPKGSPLTAPDLGGCVAIAVVEHDEWNGEVRAKVRRLLPVEGAES